MAVNSVLSPYPTFVDAQGLPLENGYIYIGTAGFEARTTPKASFFDVALTIPTGTASGAAIRTRAGLPIGTSNAPAMFYVDGDYSISVLDRNGVLLYSALNMTLALNVGGSLGPVLAPDGNLGATGFGFTNETNTGFVRSGTGTVQDVVQGVVVSQRTATGVVVNQPMSGSGFTSGVLAVAQPLDADLTALAGIAGVQGDLIYRNASQWTRLAAGLAGQVLTQNTGATAPEWQTGGGSNVQVFTANGTYTPTSGRKSAIVFCTGGGEAGTEMATNNAIGSGGGAGATAVAIVDISSGATRAVTVGAGGASSSGNGGTTSVGAVCSATGGGVAVATTGVMGISGGLGGAGGNSQAGAGGGSFWGGGGRVNSTAGNPGTAGLAYGSGGGGGYGNGSTQAGGAGAGGVVLILEF